MFISAIITACIPVAIWIVANILHLLSRFIQNSNSSSCYNVSICNSTNDEKNALGIVQDTRALTQKTHGQQDMEQQIQFIQYTIAQYILVREYYQGRDLLFQQKAETAIQQDILPAPLSIEEIIKQVEIATLDISIVSVEIVEVGDNYFAANYAQELGDSISISSP